jgi:polysaccharide biosynthesis protein VpsQ
LNTRWLAFAGCLALVAAVIFLADNGGARWLFRWIERNPGSDKAGHFILVGALAFLLNLALAGRKVAGLLLGGILIGIALTLEEASQAWNPARNFDLLDLAANLAGVFAADLAARWRLRGRLAKRRPTAMTSRDADPS